MPTVHAVITDPYYKQPAWLPNVPYREHVRLSASSATEDAVLFFTLLCGFNDIEVDREPNEVVRELISQEEVAMRGGAAFIDGETEIIPSCCCGLENWREVLELVMVNKDVWLGHDPFPVMQYEEGKVKVWSDDYTGTMRKPLSDSELTELYSIEYNQDDLIEQLQLIEKELIEFYQVVLVKELGMVDEQLREQLFQRYCEWFQLKQS